MRATKNVSTNNKIALTVTFATLKSSQYNIVTVGNGGLVICRGKGNPTSSEHCKQLKKLLMLMSAIVSRERYITGEATVYYVCI